ncbi:MULTISPECIES: ribonuclease D [unclassified Modicisalibacter]|uniref:ribonuclease D n=1 Tax=unclassified Modicisalibacter TaxID=2679913 RepID=UPI001CC9A572|nr:MULTISPECIES: ribonuclease D [unclassified Modicisalibacter]MBZ9560396.1 ribonuclease D [Modicisalibacter sp. R2A 31.J]MBZ9576305.1 ribonuclease D [Modicisalibacter sp. MOD 31.J]
MPLEPISHWIDTPEELDTVCSRLADAEWLAVDTEFFRETSFHPVPALVQLSRGDVAYLIDPQAVAATPALQRLLGPEGPTKLLHASSEDLEVLHNWSGVVLQPLVDTQVAQALISEIPSMGYQRLVEHWTGDVLPKDETRSDWLARPLSEAQQRYAALDVIYLPRVWAAQREALLADARLAWLEADCAALVDQALRSAQGDAEWYRRHRQLWRLGARAIAAYQRLTAWREAEVRRRDLPRNWLVSDKVLFAIAESMPGSRYELAAVEGVKPSLVKREGDTLLGLVRDAAQLDEAELPPALPSPLSAPFKRRLKALKRAVGAIAEDLGIAPEVLARRRDLEALVVADLEGQPLPLPEGWRGELLGDALVAALESAADTAQNPVNE